MESITESIPFEVSSCMFICPSCENEYGNQEDLNRHIETIHDGSEETFPSLCSSSTFQHLSKTVLENSSSSFQQVSVSAQEDTERYVTTRGKRKLVDTEIHPTPPKKQKVLKTTKDFLCNICHNNFARKFNLERHIKSIH